MVEIRYLSGNLKFFCLALLFFLIFDRHLSHTFSRGLVKGTEFTFCTGYPNLCAILCLFHTISASMAAATHLLGQQTLIILVAVWQESLACHSIVFQWSDLKLHMLSKKGMHYKEAFIYKYVCIYTHKNFNALPHYSQALFWLWTLLRSVAFRWWQRV